MNTPSQIAIELKRLAEEHGGVLTPKAVVDAARSETSPLHRSFDWDDTEAAEKWRLLQARNLIRVVVAYEPVADGKTLPCRVFVSLTPDREQEHGGYRVTSSVMSDPDQRRQLLHDARADMKRFTLKYRQLEELADVFAAMDRATEEAPLQATA